MSFRAVVRLLVSLQALGRVDASTFRRVTAPRTSNLGLCTSSIVVAFAGTSLTPKRATICRILTAFDSASTLTLPEARALPTLRKNVRYRCL